jgi:hypothetical protein
MIQTTRIGPNMTVADLPLKRTWLADIVDVLLFCPNGTAHVSTIADHVMKAGRDVGAEPESTITRAINNFCSHARDAEHAPKADLFARVDIATYKLRSYPARPSLIDIQDVEFSDDAFQYVWARFVAIATRKSNAKWVKASHTLRLEAFIRNIAPGGACAYLFDDFAALQAILGAQEDVHV